MGGWIACCTKCNKHAGDDAQNVVGMRAVCSKLNQQPEPNWILLWSGTSQGTATMQNTVGGKPQTTYWELPVCRIPLVGNRKQYIDRIMVGTPLFNEYMERGCIVFFHLMQVLLANYQLLGNQKMSCNDFELLKGDKTSTPLSGMGVLVSRTDYYNMENLHCQPFIKNGDETMCVKEI